MRKDFLFIMFLIWMGFLVGCRASLESKARRERTTATVAALELHRVDSLWSSLVERLKYRIEFYPTTLHTNIQESPVAVGNPPRERTNPPLPPLGRGKSVSRRPVRCLAWPAHFLRWQWRRMRVGQID